MNQKSLWGVVFVAGVWFFLSGYRSQKKQELKSKVLYHLNVREAIDFNDVTEMSVDLGGIIGGKTMRITVTIAGQDVPRCYLVAKDGTVARWDKKTDKTIERNVFYL